jgi:hypothetical protein
MRRALIVGIACVSLALGGAGSALAGQPNQNCETLGNQPGNAINASGSAFNPDGQAGSVYAGTQANNTVNQFTFSQYDVACAKNSSH